MPAARRLIKIGLVVALVVAFILSGTVWLPLYSLGPAPAREILPLIQVSGHPEYGSSGRFVMTSVRFRQLTALGALLAWLDPDLAVVPMSDLFTPGETRTEEHQRAISQMDQSKLDATSVVLSDLTGYPKDHRPGALVEAVVPGCAANGELYPGDLIRSIDGQVVRGAAQASRLIESARSGSTLSFDIRAGGEQHLVDLRRAPCGGTDQPLVGVSLISNFPFRVLIESGDVGGPSAGLMWALGLYDLLTPGDLTAGRTIAGTGQIGLDGRVYPIGGIEEKVVAAEHAGASVFLVPERNIAAARSAGGDGMVLQPVSSFRDAVDYLRSGS
jgi:PDZ domain-containing protein